MTQRLIAFVVLAGVLAVGFVLLGFWQLDRLDERRARNHVLAARLAEPVAPFSRLGGDAAQRRAFVSGTPDDSHEIVFTGRSRNGSPGVYILTPIRPPKTDTAVLVLRGWVYAPDAASIDRARWREGRSTFTGYVNALPPTSVAPEPRASERKLRALSLNSVRSLLPYPVAPHYLVSQDSGGDQTPARLPMPPLDEGPHLSYAIQWFAFALIALGGAAAVVYRARAGAVVYRARPARDRGATGA